MDITAINGTESPGAAATGVLPSQIDKESFLRLLVAQLRHQDPLEPVENSEFIAQLASFQSLETQISMGRTLDDLVSIQESQLALAGLSQAALLVGKHVTYLDPTSGDEGSGIVKTVSVENGVMMVEVGNRKVPVASLTSLSLASPASPPTGNPAPAPVPGDQPNAPGVPDASAQPTPPTGPPPAVPAQPQ